MFTLTAFTKLVDLVGNKNRGDNNRTKKKEKDSFEELSSYIATKEEKDSKEEKDNQFNDRRIHE
jgi:hypothetical protein